MLTMSSSDLHEILVSDSLEFVFLMLEFGKFDVNGSSHAGSKVGRAGSDVTKMVIMGKLSNLLNAVGSSGDSLEDFFDVGSLLHGDNTELILFINPHKEGLGVVVIDSSSFGPVPLKSAGLKVLVSLLEKEMIINKLLLLGRGHAGERVVFTLKITFEFGEGFSDFLLNFSSLLTSNCSSKRIISKVSSNSDSGGVDHAIFISRELGALKFLIIHVANMLVIRSMSVISLDDFVHKRSKGVEGIVGSTINTDTRFNPFASGEDGLLEGIPILIFSIFALLPDLSVETLAQKRFCSSGEIGEISQILR